jgi:hypothetical protein
MGKEICQKRRGKREKKAGAWLEGISTHQCTIYWMNAHYDSVFG